MMEDNQDGLLDADYMDQNSKSKYAADIAKAHQQILSDLQQISPNGEKRVTEQELLSMLHQKMPPNKQLNSTLFVQFFKDLNRDMENKIDLDEFTRKYIQVHEQLKMYLDLGKKEIEKEKNIKSDLENKIFDVKNEEMTKYNISKKSSISIEIGKLNLYSGNFEEDTNLFFTLFYEGATKKTSNRKLEDLDFIEKITFPVERLETNLEITLYSSDNPDYALGTSSIPLDLPTPNEEINPTMELILNSASVGVFSPKILLITSYNDYYQRELQNSENKIANISEHIKGLAGNLESISEPYKKVFDDLNPNILKKSVNATQNNAADSLEVFLKNNFKQKDIKWLDLLKYTLAFCIFTSFITTLDRIDFISIFIEIIFFFMVATRMIQYFNKYFYVFLAFIIVTLLYDLIDLFFLRKIKFKTMHGVRIWVGIFSLLGFLGKLLFLIFFWVCKAKVFSKEI